MVVNVEKLLKMVKNGDFSKFVKNGEMLKNIGENIKKIYALIFFYTLDIKNIIFNPKFYQHFLPSLLITYYVSTRGLFLIIHLCGSLMNQKLR